MATRKLKNYLRMYRKKAALTQVEIAYLLGCKDGARVSRYERFKSLPTLETALAYEAIFRIPVRDLFAGVFEEVERKTLRRIERMAGILHCPDRLLSRIDMGVRHQDPCLFESVNDNRHLQAWCRQCCLLLR